jgi:hypothetical protein
MTVMNLYSMLYIAQEITIQMMKKQHRFDVGIIFLTPNICWYNRTMTTSISERIKVGVVFRDEGQKMEPKWFSWRGRNLR